MTWHWPAYPNSSSVRTGQTPTSFPGPGRTTRACIPLPQIGINAVQMDPNLCQCYHTAMNVAMMDGSVRNISRSLTQQTWTNALNPSDGHGCWEAIGELASRVTGFIRFIPRWILPSCWIGIRLRRQSRPRRRSTPQRHRRTKAGAATQRAESWSFSHDRIRMGLKSCNIFP